MRIVLFQLCVLAPLFLPLALNAAAGPDYSITPLDIPNETIIAGAFNSNGQIVLSIARADLVAGDALDGEAFLLSGSTITPISPGDGIDTTIFDINNAGVAVGMNTDAMQGYAVRYDGTTLSRINVPGASGSIAYAVNNAGTVVGQATFVSETRAFVEDSTGNVVSLGTLGGDTSVAYDVNADGAVVGVSRLGDDFKERAFLWQGQSMISLGTLGGRFSAAGAINDAGMVVGDSETASGQFHAALFSVGAAPVDLGMPWAYSAASDVNYRGLIVGTVGADGTDIESVHAAIFSTSGPPTLLEDLVTSGDRSGRLLYASHVNDLGQILGVGEFDGRRQMFLATPTPEPSSLAMAILAATGLFARRLFCRKQSVAK